MARKPPKKPPVLSADDKIRLLHDIERNNRTLGHQFAGWIQDGARVTRMVASGNTDMIPVFWTRIYGVLTDIADQIDKSIAFIKDMGALRPSNRDAAAAVRMRSAIDELAAVFTDDELVYLQYRRHVECHPTQNHYRIRVTSKGLDDQVHHRLLDATMSVEDTDAAILRVLKKQNINENLIAIDFATRAAQRFTHLETLTPDWCGPLPR